MTRKCPTTYCMDVQGIHCQVIGVQMELLENLFQGELFALGIINNTVSIHTVGFLDETQKVLLVHAGCSVDVCVHLRNQRDSCELGCSGTITGRFTNPCRRA